MNEAQRWIRDHALPGARYAVGHCPHCSGMAGQSDTGHVFRSSPRSVTMRCRRCGLQWTMTWHKLAQASRKWIDGLKGPARKMAEDVMGPIREIAEVVGENRGRRAAQR